MAAAGQALRHRVDLLGSGPVELGEEIDWHRDYKTGHRWPVKFHRDIDYVNLDRPSDVKFPWELSRLHWLIPAGQAHLLTGEERFARAARDTLDSWIAGNPYALGVNWACTMEVALRIVTWTWLFACCHASDAWRSSGFRSRFLCSLFLHGRFTERNLEKSDVNGNHYLADAAGLVFGGLFFGRGRDPERWAALGWRILEEELPRQTSEDGVDHEGSIAYHRLVTELFLLPALLRLRHGLDVAAAYRERLIAMGSFIAAYSRPDGSSPLVGDADDGRALPFGGQPIGDHRYLAAIIGLAFDHPALARAATGPPDELAWLLGTEAVERLSAPGDTAPRSTAAGGYYVMANASDHVFVDCAPVGLAGRGGHGHNDCLSFEAVLDGTPLVSDAGAYLYTASPVERNRFRSTAFHNTPQVDGQEINRFVAPDLLWSLHFDAVPSVDRWRPGAERDLLLASHAGYLRLPDPVRVERLLGLDHAAHRLLVRDRFEARQPHEFRVPLLLSPAVAIETREHGRLLLSAGGRRFRVRWLELDDWRLEIVDGLVSPSYGRLLESRRLSWTRMGTARPLTVAVEPATAEEHDLRALIEAWS